MRPIGRAEVFPGGAQGTQHFGFPTSACLLQSFPCLQPRFTTLKTCKYPDSLTQFGLNTGATLAQLVCVAGPSFSVSWLNSEIFIQQILFCNDFFLLQKHYIYLDWTADHALPLSAFVFFLVLCNLCFNVCQFFSHILKLFLLDLDAFKKIPHSNC